MESTNTATATFLARAWWQVFNVFTILCICPTIAACGARWSWTLSLAAHFRAQYFVVLCAVLLVYAWKRRWRWVALSSVFLVWNGVLIAPLYFGGASVGSSDVDTGHTVKVMSANVLVRNQQYAEFLDEVRRENPDVLVVLEVNNAWEAKLSELATSYPYFRQVPRGTPFGLSLFSRVELSRIDVIDLGKRNPTLSVTASFPDADLHIIGAHLLSPVRTSWWAGQRREFAALSDHVRSLKGHVVVMGDLNATEWDPGLADCLSTTRLRDSRPGFGIQPSWGPWPMSIAIDHILVSDGLSVLERRLGSRLASDHLPVIATLRVPPGR